MILRFSHSELNPITIVNHSCFQYCHRLALIAFSVLLSIGLSMLTMPTAHAITVYKTTGVFGEVKYSQFPPEQGAKVEIIELRNTVHISPTPIPNQAREASTTNNPTAYPTSNRNGSNQPHASIPSQHGSSQQINPDPTESRHHCKTLETNLNVLKAGGIIHETESNGKTQTLSAHEIALKRENLQKMFTQYCSG